MAAILAAIKISRSRVSRSFLINYCIVSKKIYIFFFFFFFFWGGGGGVGSGGGSGCGGSQGRWERRIEAFVGVRVDVNGEKKLL